jgi:hypothetical protein
MGVVMNQASEILRVVVAAFQLGSSATAGYPAEHQLAYLAEGSAVGAVGATMAAIAHRARHGPSARVELWALFGGMVGLWIAFMLILISPVLS